MHSDDQTSQEINHSDKEFAFLKTPQGWTAATLASAVEHTQPGQLLQVSSQQAFLLLE
jgi:hypothetical protein